VQFLQTEIPYVCPATRVSLHPDGGLLKADRDVVAYPVRDGIPNFLRFGAAPEFDDADEFNRLNAAARTEGWRAALQQVYGAKAPGMVRYVTETGRTSFIELLGLRADDDVLEIGPGLGQVTTVLARRVRSLCALEVVPGQAEYVSHRCMQEGLSNVRVAVGGDDCRLPYADGSFDAVVLNLVFEWCASRCADEDPVAVQRRLLDEMARVLRPGGTLYLATKNRYALKYLIGKHDEHMHHLRFGSALPRWLSRLALRRKGLPRAPGLLHSYGALANMLRDAGFDSLRSYWAVPEVRYPTEYVPTDAESVHQARRREGFVQSEGRSTRLLMRWVPAAWVRQVAPGLAFLARKGSSHGGSL